jgi:3-methylcrotonyl-CoA carboxylase alpha subunit
MALQISIEGGDLRDVALTRTDLEQASIWIDGREHRALLRPKGGGYEVAVDDRTEPIWLVVHHDEVFIHAFGRAWRTEVVDPAERSAQQADAADVITAPMPGTVVTVAVAPGEQVESGQPLVVIESMKMQSELIAWRDGVVERVHLDVGDTFDRGAALVGLVPEEQAA